VSTSHNIEGVGIAIEQFSDERLREDGIPVVAQRDFMVTIRPSTAFGMTVDPMRQFSDGVEGKQLFSLEKQLFTIVSSQVNGVFKRHVELLLGMRRGMRPNSYHQISWDIS
jgi:hypothetical protein